MFALIIAAAAAQRGLPSCPCVALDADEYPGFANACTAHAGGAPGREGAPWCFVDAGRCDVEHLPSSFPGRAFSYATCDGAATALRGAAPRRLAGFGTFIYSPGGITGLFSLCVLTAMAFWFSFVGCKNRTTAQEVSRRGINRATLDPRNGRGLGRGTWNGTMKRLVWDWSAFDLVDREANQKIDLVVASDGTLTGSTTDPISGQVHTVDGRLSWSEGKDGLVCWREEGPYHTLEASGTMKQINDHAVITAQYFGVRHLTPWRARVQGTKISGSYVLSVAMPGASLLTGAKEEALGKVVFP